MEITKGKPGFFDQLIYSVQPSKYKELSSQPKRKVISYTVILLLCLTIMSFAVPVVGFFMSVDGYDNFVTKVLPEVKLDNGKLFVDSKIEIGKESASHILIDTSVEIMSDDMIDKEKHIAEILIGQENMIVYNQSVGAMSVDFGQFRGVRIDNQELLKMKVFVYFLLTVSFFSSMFSVAFNYILTAAFIALLCWGPFGLKGVGKIKYTKVLILAIYAQSVPKLLLAFNSSANLISNQYILVYVGIAATMILLMNGLRRAEEKKI